MVQRVSQASVEVGGEVVDSIGAGLLVLLGVGAADTVAEAKVLAKKLHGLRIFADEAGKMNLSIDDVRGEVLVVSQFTLYGDVVKGRRPSFVAAARPEVAEPIVDSTIDALRELGVATAAGRFGAEMAVSLVNDGPVTVIIEVVDGRVV